MRLSSASSSGIDQKVSKSALTEELEEFSTMIEGIADGLEEVTNITIVA